MPLHVRQDMHFRAESPSPDCAWTAKDRARILEKNYRVLLGSAAQWTVLRGAEPVVGRLMLAGFEMTEKFPNSFIGDAPDLQVLEPEALARIVGHAPMAIAVLEGPELRYALVNSAYRTLFGPEEVFIGRTLREALPEIADSGVERALRDVLGTARPQKIRDFEAAVGGREPAICWTADAMPLRRSPGKPEAVLVFVSDITDRNRTEAALRESEERFRAMADGLPLIVWVHDANGAQQFVNRTFCEFFGVSLEEMRGDRWQLLMHPEDAAAYRDEFLACTRERRAFHAEVRVRRADGEWRWIESWARPRVSPAGEFLGFVGASADVTTRKQTQETLRRTIAQSQAIFNQMTEGLVIFDPQGNLLDMNPAALEIHGFATIDKLQRHLNTLTDTFELFDLEGGALPTDAWPIGRVLRGETFKSYEVRVRRPETGKAWIGSYGGAPVYDPQGKLLLAIVTLRDVTAHYEAEQALTQAKQQLETALTATEMGVWHWDVEKNLMRGDRNMLKWFGFDNTEQALPLEVFVDRIHALDRDRVLAAVEHAITTKGLYEEEYRVVYPDGRVLWVHVRGRVDADEQGRAAAFPGVAVDVTARKQAEEALREANQHKDEFLATPVRDRSAASDRQRRAGRRTHFGDDGAPNGAHRPLGRRSARRLAHQSRQDCAAPANDRLDRCNPNGDGDGRHGIARQPAAFDRSAQRIRARDAAGNILLVAVTGWGQSQDHQRVKQAGFDHHLIKPVAVGDIERVFVPGSHGS